jgi:hypothetical protein
VISPRVASTAAGFVVVMDWTAIGAVPPTRTLPTEICLVFFLGIISGKEQGGW